MKIVVDCAEIIGQRQTRVLDYPQGPPGAPAKVSMTLSISGIIAARNPILPSPLILAGNGIFDPTACRGRSFIACTGVITWDVTKNGTFASETVATDMEVAAAIFAHIAFPAGPGPAVWTFPAGGAYSDADVLRIWQSAAGPDATQNMTSLSFAGD